MKLKTLYSFSVVGILLTGFGGGWIVLSQILQRPVDSLTAIGAAFAMIGMAVMISTLSTIKKIDLIIEDENG